MKYATNRIKFFRSIENAKHQVNKTKNAEHIIKCVHKCTKIKGGFFFFKRWYNSEEKWKQTVEQIWLIRMGTYKSGDPGRRVSRQKMCQNSHWGREAVRWKSKFFS